MTRFYVKNLACYLGENLACYLGSDWEDEGWEQKYPLPASMAPYDFIYDHLGCRGVCEHFK